MRRTITALIVGAAVIASWVMYLNAAGAQTHRLLLWGGILVLAAIVTGIVRGDRRGGGGVPY